MNILEDAKQIISKQAGVTLDQLSPPSRLEAADIESFEIIFAFEKKYEVVIPFNNANEFAALAFTTISQVADAVGKLGAEPA
jgi:acyl carrier protein